jgi:hypothetical protein
MSMASERMESVSDLIEHSCTQEFAHESHVYMWRAIDADAAPDAPPQNTWFYEEYERAKKRNALIPPHARMVVTNPILSAHTRKTTRVLPPGVGRASDTERAGGAG